MNNQLQVVKSEIFNDIKLNFYSNQKDIFMTINQLALCLGYASKSGVENILIRNEHLKTSEFSNTHKLWVVSYS